MGKRPGILPKRSRNACLAIVSDRSPHVAVLRVGSERYDIPDAVPRITRTGHGGLASAWDAAAEKGTRFIENCLYFRPSSLVSGLR